ncbi:MAG: hypothetical protein ACOH2I_13765 [Pseudomonas sp.]
MKASTLSSIHVRPELCQAAEAVLKPGETLSALIEEALAQSIALRQNQREFIARGMASATGARQSGRYIESDAVLDALEQRLQDTKALRKNAR